MKNFINKLFCRKPNLTREGTKLIWLNDKWIEVCDFCGGNCGQCGWSVGSGIPASMNTMIESLHK